MVRCCLYTSIILIAFLCSSSHQHDPHRFPVLSLHQHHPHRFPVLVITPASSSSLSCARHHTSIILIAFLCSSSHQHDPHRFPVLSLHQHHPHRFPVLVITPASSSSLSCARHHTSIILIAFLCSSSHQHHPHRFPVLVITPASSSSLSCARHHTSIILIAFLCWVFTPASSSSLSSAGISASSTAYDPNPKYYAIRFLVPSSVMHVFSLP